MTRRLLALACVLSILVGGAGIQPVAAAYNPPTVISPTVYIPIETPSTVDLSEYVRGGSGQFSWALEMCNPVQNEAGSASLDATTGELSVVPNEVFTQDGFGRVCFSVANTVPVSTRVYASVEFLAIYPLQAGDGTYEVDPRDTLVGHLNLLVSGGTGGFTFSLESPTSHGTIVVSANGDFEYVPDGGPSNQDTFTYRVTDFDGTEAVGTVIIFLVFDTSVPSYGSVGTGGSDTGGGQPSDVRSPGSTSPTEPDDNEGGNDTGRGTDSCGRCN
jgi:hypothetical protein